MYNTKFHVRDKQDKQLYKFNFFNCLSRNYDEIKMSCE